MSTTKEGHTEQNQTFIKQKMHKLSWEFLIHLDDELEVTCRFNCIEFQTSFLT